MPINAYLRQDGRKGIWVAPLPNIGIEPKFAVRAVKRGERAAKYGN